MDDIELEKLFELFDRALTSTDERVVNALRSLLMIAALTDTSNVPTGGPLKQMMDRMRALEQRVSTVENDRRNVYPLSGAGNGYPWSPQQTGPWTTSGTSPTWTANPASSSYTYSTPTLNTGAATGTLDPSYSTAYSLSLSDTEIDDILARVK